MLKLDWEKIGWKRIRIKKGSQLFCYEPFFYDFKRLV